MHFRRALRTFGKAASKALAARSRRVAAASTIGFASSWKEGEDHQQQQQQEGTAAAQHHPQQQHPPHSLLEIIGWHRRHGNNSSGSGTAAAASRPIPIPSARSSSPSSPFLSSAPLPLPPPPNGSLRSSPAAAAAAQHITVPSYVTGRRRAGGRKGSAGSNSSGSSAATSPASLGQQQQLAMSPLLLARSPPSLSSSPSSFTPPPPPPLLPPLELTVLQQQQQHRGIMAAAAAAAERQASPLRNQQQLGSGAPAEAEGEDEDGSIAAARAEAEAQRAEQELQALEAADAAAAGNSAEAAAALQEQQEREDALGKVQVFEMTEAAMRLALEERPDLRLPFESFRRKVTATGRLELTQEDLTDPLRWQALGPFLAACPEIRALRLQGMEIGKEEAAALSNGVLRQIRHVTFCGNSIGATSGCLEILVALLLLCEYLESAAILHNSITDKQIDPVLRLLREHQTLTSLDLCWNGLGDSSAAQLSRALRLLQHSLCKLDLSYNRLSREGQKKLRAVQAELRDSGRPIEIHTHGNPGCSPRPPLFPAKLYCSPSPLKQHPRSGFVAGRSIGLRGQLFGAHAAASPLLRRTRSLRFQRHPDYDTDLSSQHHPFH